MINVNLQLDTLLVWILVGLVAGFLASHATLGHGMGIIADVLVGIIGAILGGFLANYFDVRITIAGHPILSEMIIAFFGAIILLLLLRVVGFGRPQRRAV
jgi:uncharacterized membrane protein YeaQ/YmgE (transglycosylase-associated protein family)